MFLAVEFFLKLSLYLYLAILQGLVLHDFDFCRRASVVTARFYADSAVRIAVSVARLQLIVVVSLKNRKSKQQYLDQNGYQ